MPGLDDLLGRYGFYIAVAAMAAATYLCRAAGYVVMARVKVTPAVERGLQALPGSIVMAIVLPIAIRHGIPAIAGVALGLGVMLVVRNELVALLAGLALVTAMRASGW